MKELSYKIDKKNVDLFLAFTNALRLTVYFQGNYGEQIGYDDTGLLPVKIRYYSLFTLKAGETRKSKLEHFISKLPE